MAFWVLALIASVLVATASAQWVKQTVNTTAGFRGLSVVNEKIVWASGTGGTVIRTINGGKSWDVMNVPGAEKLDFRDIEAFDAKTAYILSIGNGEARVSTKPPTAARRGICSLRIRMKRRSLMPWHVRTKYTAMPCQIPSKHYSW